MLEQAAVKIRTVKPAFVPIENPRDLLARCHCRPGELVELLLDAFRPPVQNFDNQPFLAREVPIHGHLGDFGLGIDLVYAGGV